MWLSCAKALILTNRPAISVREGKRPSGRRWHEPRRPYYSDNEPNLCSLYADDVNQSQSAFGLVSVRVGQNIGLGATRAGLAVVQSTLRLFNCVQFGPGRPVGRRLFHVAFSLVELLTAMAITSILIVAMGSTMIVATKAMLNSSSPGVADLQAAHVINQFVQEIGTAISFSVRSANEVVFTVADRDNDAIPEVISYAWSGTVGDPLTRQYKGSTITNIADNVYEFALSYNTTIITEQIPTTIESSETQLASHMSPNSRIKLNITTNQWLSQSFQPSLPPDALRWSVTRVLLMARQQGLPDGRTFVQLRPSDSNVFPSSTVLEQEVMNESSLTSSFSWQQFHFNVSDLFPDDTLCLVLEWVRGIDSAMVQCDGVGGTGQVLTTDQGANWSNGSGTSMLYSVYGRYTTPGDATIATHTYLEKIGVGLRIGSNPLGRVHSVVSILNSPKVNP